MKTTCVQRVKQQVTLIKQRLQSAPVVVYLFVRRCKYTQQRENIL